MVRSKDEANNQISKHSELNLFLCIWSIGFLAPQHISECIYTGIINVTIFLCDNEIVWIMFFFFQPVEERNEREETRRSRDFVLCALLRPSLIKIPIHCYVLFDTCNNFCFFNDFWILKRQMRWLCNWFLIASRSNASQGPCQEKKAHKYWRNSINLICPIMQRSCRFKIPHLFVR